MKRYLDSLVIITSLWGVLSAEAQLARITFITLNDPWGGGFMWTNSDGTLYAGSYYFGGAFFWSPDEGEQTIQGDYVRDMDNNGVLVGETNFMVDWGDSLGEVEAAGYYRNGEWTMIGPVLGTPPFDPIMYQGAWAIAADTMLIAGMYWHDNYNTTAFIWSPENPIGELLPDNGLDLNSRPNAMSSDGRVIVGWASMIDNGQYTDRAAHAWIYSDSTEEYDIFFLGDLGNGTDLWHGGECYAVSPDGNLIAGASNGDLFLWSEQDQMENLGVMPNYDPVQAATIPMSMNKDTTIIGFAQPQSWLWTRYAFIYTPQSGLIFLQDSLNNLGISDQLQGKSLIMANDISDDGRVIVGEAINEAGILVPFLLEFLPPDPPINFLPSFINDSSGVKIILNWNDVAFNEYSYEIQRRLTTADSTSDWSTIVMLDSNSIRYIDDDVVTAIGNEWGYRIRTENPIGPSEWVYTSQTYLSSVDERLMPNTFGITSAYPNPFNPITHVRYEIPGNTFGSLILYSLTGSQVAVVLENSFMEAGNHETEVDLHDYSSGIYFLELRTQRASSVRKLMLVK